MSPFEKFCMAITLVVVLILGSVVLKQVWSDTPVPAKQQSVNLDPELGPNETLILAAAVITVGIVAGVIERTVFGDKESRKRNEVPDES